MDFPVRPFNRPRTFDDVKAAIVRRANVIIVCFLALSAGATAAVIMARPQYQAEMKLLVKHDRADSMVTASPESAPVPNELSENELLSQVELIKSNDLLERVAVEAGLTGQIVASGRARNDAEAMMLAKKDLARDLRVTPIKRTWLIDIAYQSEDQKSARHVLDTLSRLYLEKHLALHRPTGIYEFFSQQTEQARHELEAAEDELIEFGRRNGLVSASLEREGVLQRFLEFDALRAQAAAASAETQQRLTAVSAELSKAPAQQVGTVRVSDDANATRDIKARILSLEAQRTELLQKFTPQYRGIQEIDAQLTDLRAALAQAQTAPVKEETLTANPTRQWLDTERARTVADHASAQARMQALSAAASAYRAKAQNLDAHGAEEQELVRRVKTAEQKYLLYAQKQEEARISDELDRTRIANVVVAQAPSVDIEPKRSPSLAMLPLLLGISLLFSFAAALTVDLLDPNVKYASVLAPVLTPQIRALRRHNDWLEERIRARSAQAGEELREAATLVQNPIEDEPERGCDNVVNMPAPSYLAS